MRTKIYQWLCKVPTKVGGGVLAAFGVGEKFLPDDWPERVMGMSPEQGHLTNCCTVVRDGPVAA